MRARSIAATVLGLLVTSLVILAALAPGSKTITMLPTVELEDVDSLGPNSAVVIAKYESGGSSILGLTR
jgi:hypothetical protein